MPQVYIDDAQVVKTKEVFLCHVKNLIRKYVTPIQREQRCVLVHKKGILQRLLRSMRTVPSSTQFIWNNGIKLLAFGWTSLNAMDLLQLAARIIHSNRNLQPYKLSVSVVKFGHQSCQHLQLLSRTYNIQQMTSFRASFYDDSYITSALVYWLIHLET